MRTTLTCTSGSVVRTELSNETNTRGHTRGVAEDDHGNVFKVSVCNPAMSMPVIDYKGRSAMHRITGALLAVFVVVVPTNQAQASDWRSQASDWRLVAEGVDHSTLEIDLGSIKPQDGFVTAWVRRSYKSPQTDLGRHAYRSTMTLWAYDCKADRSQLLQSMAFEGPAGRGSAVASENRYLSKDAWSYVQPDTVDEAALKFVCSHAQSKAHRQPAGT